MSVRLWVNSNLSAGEKVVLSPEQSHYLSNVMRRTKGDIIYCFNQNNGEYTAEIDTIDKHKTLITVLKQTKKTQTQQDIWLVFAPLKKDKTDFVIEKSVELGVAKIIPVITARTNSNQIKTERFAMQAIEASEQCGRLSVPDIENPCSLSALLENWDKNRILYFMDERRQGGSALEKFAQHGAGKSAILIGPEGGFSDEEALLINQQPFVVNIQLGQRILRAETAALSALTLWQAAVGDWQKTKE